MITNDQLQSISFKLERVYNACLNLSEKYTILINEQKRANELLETNNMLIAAQLGLISKEELVNMNFKNKIYKKNERRY